MVWVDGMKDVEEKGLWVKIVQEGGITEKNGKKRFNELMERRKRSELLFEDAREAKDFN